MFESVVRVEAVVPAGLPTDTLAELVVENHAALMVRETRVLMLAAAWADAHDLDSGGDDYQPLIERACAWGGVGTPGVSEYCAVELGALQGTGSVAAQALIADALDLRHRLPRLWRQVQAGQVRAWQARKVAEATRSLSWEAVQEVDDEVSGFVGMLPWGRFQRVLGAAIVQADPALAAERVERARAQREVVAFDGEDGLKTLVAKATSGDVVWFMATVNRIAEILGVEGDGDPVGVRRSKAIGILAQPARALALLVDHAHDRPTSDLPTDAPAPHGDAEPERDPGAEGEPEPAPEDDSRPDPSLELTPPASFSTGDAKALRPRVVLYFHLSDAGLASGNGLVRPEHGTPLSVEQLKVFLADTECAVTVRPVVDPADTAPVDGYEVPLRLRSAMRLRNPNDVFPFGTCTSASMDLDHNQPYVAMSRGGPPGQTGVHNLAPFVRRHHRAVTFGGWARRQPEPGVWVFRSPTGYVFLVTNHGTLRLGRGGFARALWHTARPGSGTPEVA